MDFEKVKNPPKDERTRASGRWTPPIEVVYKLNVDASFLSSSKAGSRDLLSAIKVAISWREGQDISPLLLLPCRLKPWQRSSMDWNVLHRWERHIFYWKLMLRTWVERLFLPIWM